MKIQGDGTQSRPLPVEHLGMNAYLVLLLRGEGSIEIEADFYGQDGNDFVFTSDGQEVRRVSMFDVSSISKAR